MEYNYLGINFFGNHVTKHFERIFRRFNLASEAVLKMFINY